MSLYASFWYQGIIKPEFRPQVQEMFRKQLWSCDGPPLGDLLRNAFDEAAPSFHTPDPRFDDSPEVWISPVHGIKPSFDPESGLLRCFANWNLHGLLKWQYHNLEEWILPYLTERLISYHCWIEPSGDETYNEICDNAAVFAVYERQLAIRLQKKR